MSARTVLLVVAMGAAITTTSCSTVVPDSSPGPTLVPLETLPLPSTAPSASVDDSDVEVADAGDAAPSDAEDELTTSTTSTSTTTTSPTTTTTSTTSTTAPSTTAIEARPGGLVDGVQATIGGRSLSFAASCRDGRAVKLDGVTWAFGGNSFRFSGGDDVRSQAELVGDGWTMPMVVASVQSGVYRYVGTPVDGSVGSAEVTVDHTSIPSC